MTRAEAENYIYESYLKAEKVQSLFWNTWTALKLLKKQVAKVKGLHTNEFKTVGSFCTGCRGKKFF